MLLPSASGLASHPGGASTEGNLNFEFVRRQVANPPAWSADVIRSWADAFPSSHHAFLVAHYWSDSAAVNVHRVVGTEHWDYQGKTWLGFLQSGKRMQPNLQALLDNPNYYRDLVRRQPSIHYNTLDGLDFYIGADGNHRTCIARFFLAEDAKAEIHGVTLNHYQLNHDFLRCYEALRASIQTLRLPVDLQPWRSPTGREDTASWKLDHYKTELLWHAVETGEQVRLGYEQAQDRLVDLQYHIRLKQQEPPPRSWLQRMLSRRTKRKSHHARYSDQ